jgi:hypothetical protein
MSTLKKPAPARKQPASATAPRRALTQRKKSDLVEVLRERAQADRGVLRPLTARCDGATTPDELVAAPRQAIADATAFDERDIKRNFDSDYEASGEVKRNLGRLIASGPRRLARPRALDLRKRGSYQVERSDERVRAEDIEDGLSVVIEALTKGDVPAEEVLAWGSAMLATERRGFIARKPLEALRHQVQAAKTQEPAVRFTGGQRAPLRPASDPDPPRAEPFASRTPIGLPPSAA